ncbi:MULTISPECIES: alpha/beta fold hydrolase [Microbacterium]|uniref:alpha/beta fold hydrolase n=1 Tax=Microbacterium TaxID=33882 RepID=UPI002786A527|nr:MULTISPECIES: alpha/beta fold hydrolase [Microbacterium]MDQ1085267.1 proline iminopeptidase [Microbacterium sp. SORGH_AS_0344]MDQ1169425.1 proline iminopeptidase [Microbacterium proteolyticum]
MREIPRVIRRPAAHGAPAFDLASVRSGPRGATPVVVIPGGPGLASLLPYRGLRRWAADGGLDIVMMEHRGIGRSRTDLTGRPLPPSAMRIDAVLDDLVAVLDAEGVTRAVIVGSSYGSYLAMAFGARHPDRVAAMLLDSALQSTRDIGLERARLRELFWDADDELAAGVRRLMAAGVTPRVVLDIVRAAYELGGTELVLPLLRHRPGLAWKALGAYATRDGGLPRIPGVYEFDLVGTIAFRELGYAGTPDGHPLDPALTYLPLAPRFPAFVGEPLDLVEAVRAFAFPLVVLAGDRDLRTPPAIAERIAASAPDAALVRIRNGHSALDTHPLALLNATRRLVRGQQARLPGEEAALDRLPRRGLSASLPGLLLPLARLDALLRRRVLPR